VGRQRGIGDWHPSDNFGWCCVRSGFVHTRHELFRDAPLRPKLRKHREGGRGLGSGGEKVEKYEVY